MANDSTPKFTDNLDEFHTHYREGLEGKRSYSRMPQGTFPTRLPKAAETISPGAPEK